MTAGPSTPGQRTATTPRAVATAMPMDIAKVTPQSQPRGGDDCVRMSAPRSEVYSSCSFPCCRAAPSTGPAVATPGGPDPGGRNVPPLRKEVRGIWTAPRPPTRDFRPRRVK
jgi:hypothetical protein